MKVDRFFFPIEERRRRRSIDGDVFRRLFVAVSSDEFVERSIGRALVSLLRRRRGDVEVGRRFDVGRRLDAGRRFDVCRRSVADGGKFVVVFVVVLSSSLLKLFLFY
jgi:hypothetical protein